LKCNLASIEECEFIRWCRQHAREVSGPAWWGLLTNLAYLEGGVPLAHEISRLDSHRYDFANTQRVLDRILREGYQPVSCRTIVSPSMVRAGRGVLHCSRIGKCPARAPMYLATSHTVYTL
jgi:hypothetical protein